MQVSYIGYIFPWLQTVPMSYGMPTASQGFNAVEEEVRVAVGRDGRQEEDVGRLGRLRPIPAASGHQQ